MQIERPEHMLDAKPSFAQRHPRLSLFAGVMRNLDKVSHVLPPFKNKTLQRLREVAGVPTRTDQTRQPFDLSPGLAKRVQRLGLNDALRSVRDNGFGRIDDLGSTEFNDRLREAVKRCAKETAGGREGVLLDRDPIFEEVVLHPKLLAIVEVMCGQGALLSHIAGRVIRPNSDQGHLHVVQNQLPAPFPVHNQMVAFCWACDAQSFTAGAVKVVPRSNVNRRPPSQEELEQEQDAIALDGAPGTITFWDGSTWHGRYPRRDDGELAVLYLSYCRLALCPKESYHHLGDEWLADKPFEMRVLLGREDGLDTSLGAIGSIDNFAKFVRMTNWSKS